MNEKKYNVIRPDNPFPIMTNATLEVATDKVRRETANGVKGLRIVPAK